MLSSSMISLMFHTPLHFHTAFRLFAKHLKPFLTKSEDKNDQKYIIAFGKR